MIRPIACTSCDQRSCSRTSCAFPAGGQPVVLRALVGFADAPLGFQPAALLEPMQRRIERAGLDLQQIVGLRANGLADAVAVLRAPLEGPEDEHVERALEELQALVVGRLGHSRRQSTTLDVEALLLVPQASATASLTTTSAGNSMARMGAGVFWTQTDGDRAGGDFRVALGHYRLVADGPPGDGLDPNVDLELVFEVEGRVVLDGHRDARKPDVRAGRRDGEPRFTARARARLLPCSAGSS